MAGYGADLSFDEEAMRNLPIGADVESTAARRQMFRQADMNGNGITSLAECDRLIVTVLAIKGVKIMKPVINRAFHAARDIIPSVGSISPHYVDFHEFRYFLIYLKHYLELFLIFCAIEHDRSKSRYSDRRMSYDEFHQSVPMLLDWGVDKETEAMLQDDPRMVFRAIDDNGGGVVLFDEFAHWALWHHMFHLDGADDEDMEEALEVLKAQKPNLCGKDLTSIKASKAKYRADARISGQGCLGGDPSLAGGYEDIPDGGEELAKGGHYPGGLAAWKTAFYGKKNEDEPGKYRCVARIAAIYNGKSKSGSRKIGELRTGDCVEVVEVCDLHERENRIRGRIEEPMDGWISLLNTKNGFRWTVRLKQRTRPAYDEEGAGAGAPQDDDREDNSVFSNAWRASLDRVEEANDFYEENGIPECVHGCGQPRFRRYPTCCTHCQGDDGPHARSCKGQGYKECVNGCGHPQFGKYDTCCTWCKGDSGPHHRTCKPMPQKSDSQDRSSRQDSGQRGKSSHSRRETGRDCRNGCGRQAFKTYPTCCTWCKGDDGPHHRDCDQREQDDGPRRELRNVFYKAKDQSRGLSHERFKSLVGDIIPRYKIDSVLEAVDRNGDGVIDIDEFLDWLWSGELNQEARQELSRNS